MHEPQIAGFPGYRANPMCRSTAPAGPSNGAAHSLQLGPWGRRRMTRRIRPRVGSSPERKPRMASCGVDGRGITRIVRSLPPSQNDAVITPTSRQLNRATLERQLLLRREPIGVVEAVHRVVGLQAQEPGSPYVALWNRVSGFDAAALDRAFSEHAIVKASLMRITLHAVDAADYPAFHEAMQVSLRGSRLGDRRFTSTGLTSEEADALVPELLAFADRPRSN